MRAPSFLSHSTPKSILSSSSLPSSTLRMRPLPPSTEKNSCTYVRFGRRRGVRCPTTPFAFRHALALPLPEEEEKMYAYHVLVRERVRGNGSAARKGRKGRDHRQRILCTWNKAGTRLEHTPKTSSAMPSESGSSACNKMLSELFTSASLPRPERDGTETGSEWWALLSLLSDRHFDDSFAQVPLTVIYRRNR